MRKPATRQTRTYFEIEGDCAAHGLLDLLPARERSPDVVRPSNRDAAVRVSGGGKNTFGLEIVVGAIRLHGPVEHPFSRTRVERTRYIDREIGVRDGRGGIGVTGA